MNVEKKSTGSGKIIRLLIVLLLVFLALIVFIGLNLIHTENSRLIGEAHNNLSLSQLITYDVTFFFRQSELTKRNNDLPETIISIEMDKPLNEVLIQMENDHVVSDAALLRQVLIYTGADRKILPGKYPIPAASTILEIAAILQDINASLIDFAVLPGWRKEEISAALPSSGLSINQQDFTQFINTPMADEYLSGLGFSDNEGIFAPGMYSFHRNVTTTDFVKAMTDRFQSELSTELKDGFSNQGLTLSQAVILASIIQREAVLDEEKPIIASVFINRINAGMPLQSDPTVQYALGFNPDWGWWKSPLSFDDLKVESPYNTYIITGLPPAPISNPDLTSLQAVANPTATDYFYFRALCDGSHQHVFSETLEEHIANACP
jgi:UPF0755 protein